MSETQIPSNIPGEGPERATVLQEIWGRKQLRTSYGDILKAAGRTVRVGRGAVNWSERDVRDLDLHASIEYQGRPTVAILTLQRDERDEIRGVFTYKTSSGLPLRDFPFEGQVALGSVLQTVITSLRLDVGYVLFDDGESDLPVLYICNNRTELLSALGTFEPATIVSRREGAGAKKTKKRIARRSEERRQKREEKKRRKMEEVEGGKGEGAKQRAGKIEKKKTVVKISGPPTKETGPQKPKLVPTTPPPKPAKVTVRKTRTVEKQGPAPSVPPPPPEKKVVAKKPAPKPTLPW